MTRVLLASSVVLVALVAAAAALVLVPSQAVAVFGSVVAVLGLGLSAYRDFADQGNLQVEVGLAGKIMTDKRQELYVRLYNSGRRPVRVEEIGFAASKSDEPERYPMWHQYGETTSFLPRTLSEMDSKKGWTFSTNVAHHYLDGPPIGWIFVKLVTGKLLWRRLPKVVLAELAFARPVAEAEREAGVRKLREGISPGTTK